MSSDNIQIPKSMVKRVGTGAVAGTIAWALTGAYYKPGMEVQLPGGSLASTELVRFVIALVTALLPILGDKFPFLSTILKWLKGTGGGGEDTPADQGELLQKLELMHTDIMEIKQNVEKWK